jgi:hypothetical protein
MQFRTSGSGHSKGLLNVNDFTSHNVKFMREVMMPMYMSERRNMSTERWNDGDGLLNTVNTDYDLIDLAFVKLLLQMPWDT